MIGQRDKEPRARFFIASHQLIGFPVQQSPLRAKLLVAEFRGVSVVLAVKLVLRLAGFVDIARVPVAIFGNALRAPMRPDAELRILIPLRRLIAKQ